MHDQGSVETLLPTNRPRLATRLCLGLVAMGLIVAYMRWSYTETAFEIGVAIAVIGISYAYYGPLCLLVTGRAVVITDRGMIDYTSSLGFISWSEIRGASLRPMAGLNLIVLNLVDTESFVARQALIPRMLMRFYLKKHPEGPTMAGDFVVGGAEALMDTIVSRARGGEGARPSNKSLERSRDR